jgi:diamine N-acetyltransferase
MIEGETIRLGRLQRNHLERTLAWANDPQLMLLLNRTRAVSPTEHEEWFNSLTTRTDCLYFSIETRTDHAHIGNIWLWRIDLYHKHAEVRIVIGDAKNMGRGSGTEAISLLCDYAFKELNLHKVYAYVLAINPRARRSFEKAGFQLEGILREDRWAGDAYTDVFLLGKLQ